MAATMDIREFNGVGATPTTKTSGTIRFKDADDANVDLNNPIVRPGSGSVYSYEKVLRLNLGAGLTGAITSPRAFSDSVDNLGTGVSMTAAVQDGAAFIQPVNTLSVVGTPLDFFGFTSGAPLALDSITAGPFTVIGDIADYLYIQAAVASTASPGVTSTETLVLSYDET